MSRKRRLIISFTAMTLMIIGVVLEGITKNLLYGSLGLTAWVVYMTIDLVRCISKDWDSDVTMLKFIPLYIKHHKEMKEHQKQIHSYITMWILGVLLYGTMYFIFIKDWVETVKFLLNK